MKLPANVSIIIPNWNGLLHLRQCLGSIQRQTLQPRETILVDNGSSDGSVEFVRKVHPWVQLLLLRQNSGFAVAVNRGIQLSVADHIVLLNNDTELDECWLEKMIHALGDNPQYGSIACKMLNFHDRSIIDAAGDGITLGLPFSRGHAQPDGTAFEEGGPVFGVCAGAALYRRKLFETIGYFDEDFVSYFEDADVSFRAQLAGFKCLYVPDALCYHKRGATSVVSRAYPVRMGERNLTSLVIKNFPLSMLFSLGPFIVAARIRGLYRAVRAGLGGPAMQGFLEGLALAPFMLKKRVQVQRSRIVDVKYLRSFLGR